MTTTTSPTSQASTKRRSPRQRARRMRMVQYAILVIVAALAILFANWPQIIDVFFRPSLVGETIGPGLLRALGNTILYTIGAFVFGIVLGTALALMRLSDIGPYRWLARAYIEFFRGLPAIVVFIAFGLLPIAFPGMRIPFDPYGTVWVALGMVASAYLAETIRAGIQAVPKGQVEAARSLGMPAGMAMRKVVLPQAFRIILPPITNELILLVKDSSLVYVLGLSMGGYELTKFGREASQASANLTPLVVAGFCYLLITLPLTVLVGRMESSAAQSK